MPTKVIDNFTGRLTRQNTGDMNSGFAKYSTTFGNDPFTSPSDLTWFYNPVIFGNFTLTGNGLVMAAKGRLENGITYVYVITHLGKLCKIQVNDPTTGTPVYNLVTVLTTLTINAPTFKYGTSMQFYGATEKIFIGHDLGVTKVNFDGSGEAFVGVLGSYTANVPRPSELFLGKLYFGNASNLVEIDSTETVISYARLSPSFPAGTFVRDIDVSPDGNYLEMIVSSIPQTDLTSVVADTYDLSNADSQVALWTGTTDGITSYQTYNGYSITSNMVFGPYGYVMGYDLGGAAIYSQGQKLVSLPTSTSPNFGAMFSTGNLLGFASPDFSSDVDGVATSSVLVYGQYDEEIPKGLFRFFRLSAGVDIVQIEPVHIPVCTVVSNLFLGSPNGDYFGEQVGTALIYFSVIGVDNGGVPVSNLYYFITSPTAVDALINPVVAVKGTYETQNEILHSKKVKVTEVRVYTTPLGTGNSFEVGLIGSNGTIPGTTKDFTVGTNVTAGVDMVQYTPMMAPTYTLGLQINNLGDINYTIVKVEIDWEVSGK